MYEYDLHLMSVSRKVLGTYQQMLLHIHIATLKKYMIQFQREALWMILQNLGVPERIINLLCSFHQVMHHRTKINGSILEQIDLNNGLRQGWCMSSLYTFLLIFPCCIGKMKTKTQ